MQNKTELTYILDFASEVGERVLVCGGEIWRVDEIMKQVFRTYEVKDANMFILPHTIIISARTADGETVMCHRTPGEIHPNMEQLTKLNQMVRGVRKNKPAPEELPGLLRLVPNKPAYPRHMIILGMTIALLSLNYFIGGGLIGGVLVACGIIIAMSIQMYMDEIFPMNRFFLCGLGSFLAGSLIMAAFRLGFHENPYLLMVITCIGLIPGVPLINACRELLNGKVLSGGLLFMTAFLETFAVACGFYLSMLLFGGVL